MRSPTSACQGLGRAERRLERSGFYRSGNENQAGLAIFVRPTFERHRGVEYVLHALNDDRSSFDVQDTFHPEQVGAA